MKTLNSKFLILNSQAAPVFAAWWWDGDSCGEWTVDGGWHVLNLPTMRGFGIVMWEPTFRGFPDLEDVGVENFPMTFTVLMDSSRTNGATYHWTSTDERVNILSPSARTTEVEVDSSMAGDDFELSVEACTQGRNYYSTLWYHFPTNAGPRFSLTMPDTVFVNNDDDNDDGMLDCDRRFASGITNRDDDVAFAKIGLPSGESRRGTLELYDRDGFIGTFFDASFKNDYVGQGSEWEMSDSSPDFLPLEASGSLPSDGYRSSQVKFRWTPDDGDEQMLCHRFTVVEPVVEPICSERKSVMRDGVEHRLVYNPSGVVIGKDAYFKISVTPSDYPDSKIRWQADGAGEVEFVGGNTGREVCVRGISEGDVTLKAKLGDCVSSIPSFTFKVITNQTIRLSAWIVADKDGALARTEGVVRSMVNEANDIYSQVGVTLDIGDRIIITNIPAAYDILWEGTTNTMWNFHQLVDVSSGTGGLELYFVNRILNATEAHGRTTVGGHSASGIVISAEGNFVTLAHEVGHAFGMKDIYRVDFGEHLLPGRTQCNYQPWDWNNGCSSTGRGGERYYAPNTMHSEIIGRMLMNGLRTEEFRDGVDITYGSIYGFDVDDIEGDIPTGFFRNYRHVDNPVSQ